MQYILIGGGALLGILVIYQWLRNVRARTLARSLRWITGGLLAALSAFLILRGQIFLASFTAPVAFMILKFGRIGSFTFESTEISGDNESQVKSRYVTMTLDHETGEVQGRVIAGRFRGRDLFDLDAVQTRMLLDEIAGDADSLALLETWLDKNRAGWREYFGGEQRDEPAPDVPAADADAEAYEVLGLEPGATADEIRAAHKKLMMGVHPDQGGSTYLAAKINAAKDRLLRKRRT